MALKLAVAFELTGFMLGFEPLCLSTQTVILLRLKLKRGLNALLPAPVGLGHLAFEYSIRDFLSLKTLLKHVGSVLFLLNSEGF
jgi:hypothetical protein